MLKTPHFYRYLRSFKDLNLDQQTNSDFLENPVNAFLLLRHVGLGWKEIHRTLQNTQQALQSIMGTTIQTGHINNYMGLIILFL